MSQNDSESRGVTGHGHGLSSVCSLGRAASIAMALLAGVYSSGCASRPQDLAPLSGPDPLPRSEPDPLPLSEAAGLEVIQAALQAQADARPIAWGTTIGLEVRNIPVAITNITKLVKEKGGIIRSISGADTAFCHMELGVPHGSASRVISALAGMGTVRSRYDRGEDMTEATSDAELRLRQKRALCEKLQALRATAADAASAVTLETAISQALTEIERLETRIRTLQSQVALAVIEVNLTRKPIPGPLGLVFKGLWWGIKKLFVIRE